jgi:hypothetical protein
VQAPNTRQPARFNAAKFNPLIGLLLLLFAAQFAIAVWGFFKGKGIFWEGPSMMFIPLAVYYAAFAGWRVEVTPDEITVVTFFWFRKSVQRSAITSWAAKTGWKGGDRIRNVPYRRLEIYTTKNTQPFMIPTKPLRREDYQTLVSLLPDGKKGEGASH